MRNARYSSRSPDGRGSEKLKTSIFSAVRGRTKRMGWMAMVWIALAALLGLFGTGCSAAAPRAALKARRRSGAKGISKLFDE